jgi:predicted protein tyrosine phosphatase
MIRSVDFLSQKDAQDLTARPDLALISITEPGMFEARLAEHEHLLRLAFFDSLPDPDSPWDPMSDDHAKQIGEFVRSLHASNAPFDLIAHCKAGISRSAAVALYVHAATDCMFPRRRLAGNANAHCLSMLSKSFGLPIERPSAIGQREKFWVSVLREYSGTTFITVRNVDTGVIEQAEGPIADEGRLIGIACEKLAGEIDEGLVAGNQSWDNSL